MNPVRTCVGCRKQDNRANLQRFVIGPGGPVSDLAGGMPGRGAWVHPQCLPKAEERSAIARALRDRKNEKGRNDVGKK